MKLTIARKLGFGVGIVIAMMVIGAAVAYIETGDMVASQSSVVDEAVPTARACDELDRAMHASLAALRGRIILGDDSSDVGVFNTEYDDAWASIDDALPRLEASRAAFTSADVSTLDELSRELDTLRTAQLEVMSQARAPEQRSQRLAATMPHNQAIRNKLTTLSRSADERVEASRRRMNAAAGALRATLLISTALGLAIGVTVAVTLSRTIARSIGDVVNRARAIASGDLTGAPLETRGNDEIATLATNFNFMQDWLKDVTSQIRQVTENVNAAAAEVLAAAQQQATGTKQQATTLQEITSTMQEICQSGEQASQRAQDVVAGAETTMESNQSGMVAVQASTRNMDTIREQVEEVAENITSLSQRTQTIGEIVSAVTDIAEQSNLLALNAAIEAVSAGEQGNRFGVVASEMKNLAERAKECTVQVGNLLSEIQNGINASVMMTEEAVKRVETGKEQAGTTERTIREMTGTTQSSVEAFQQIIGASAQQQIGFDQVAKGVKDIHIAVEQTAAGVTQLERAAASLDVLSQQLRTAVERYRL